jgi:DNA-binding transcriptional ArsR family regulator
MKDLEKQYKALANRRRLAILKYLKRNPQVAVGDIAREIKLGIKSTSKHLRVLAVVDFADREQRSLNVFYFLPKHQPSLLKQVLNLL